jgi:hypothetical protein
MLNNPKIVTGYRYSDKWCSPYVRGDFDLQRGRYALEVKIWNHHDPAFLNNCIDVRCGLSLLHSTGPLDLAKPRLVSAEVDVAEDNLIISVSLRSTVSWQAPPPDMRQVGFILLHWECRSLG